MRNAKDRPPVSILVHALTIQALRYVRRASLAELKRKLAERLLDENFPRAVFERLVPLQHQGSLLDATPDIRLDNIEMGGRMNTEPAHLNLPVDHHAAQMCSCPSPSTPSRRSKVVPKPSRHRPQSSTCSSRQKRLQGYIDAGKSPAVLCSVCFIPIVGEVLLVVSAAQLIDTIYEGFSAWSRGDSDEALNDLLDVAEQSSPSPLQPPARSRPAGFTAGLIKVRVAQQRLAPVALGPHAVPSSRRAAGTSGCRQPRLVSARTTAVPEAG